MQKINFSSEITTRQFGSRNYKIFSPSFNAVLSQDGASSRCFFFKKRQRAKIFFVVTLSGGLQTLQTRYSRRKKLSLRYKPVFPLRSLKPIWVFSSISATAKCCKSTLWSVRSRVSAAAYLKDIIPGIANELSKIETARRVCGVVVDKMKAKHPPSQV